MLSRLLEMCIIIHIPGLCRILRDPKIIIKITGIMEKGKEWLGIHWMLLLGNWKCLIIDVESIIDRDVVRLPVRDRVRHALDIVPIRPLLEVPHDPVAHLGPGPVRFLTAADRIRRLPAIRDLIPAVRFLNVPELGQDRARGPGRAPSLVNTRRRFAVNRVLSLLASLLVDARQFRLHLLFLVEGLWIIRPIIIITCIGDLLKQLDRHHLLLRRH